MSFDQDESKRLFELVALYTHYKSLISLAESIDASTFVPALQDGRLALDHLVRGLAVKMELTNEDEQVHFAKANLHLERAILDLIDFIAITLKSDYDDLQDGISSRIIIDAAPELHSKIYPELYRLLEEIRNLRDYQQERPNVDIDTINRFLDKNLDTINYLVNSRARLTSELSLNLAKYNQMEKHEKIKTGVIAFLAALLGAVLSILIKFLI